MEIGMTRGYWLSQCDMGAATPGNFRHNNRMSKKARGGNRKAILSVVLAFVSFALGLLVEALQLNRGIQGWMLWLDNLCAALLLGLVVFVYERRRERELIRRLQVIELMNHHVRNALQPVMYLPYSQDQETQLNMIRNAVQRIDWALREILPGASESEPPSNGAAV